MFGRSGHKILIIVIVLILFCLFPGCAKDSDDISGRLTVAVTIVPEEAFVKAVAGELAEVVTLVPPGKSPENYAPTPKQMEAFSNAELYFSIGVPVEDAYILRRTDSLNSRMKIVPLADRVEEVYPSRSRDPHIWLSPKRTAVMVDVIAEELSMADAAHREIYRRNALEFKTNLEKVNAEIEGILSKLSNRTFIVFHPAFGYFADDYGLEMISLEEEGKEATPKSLQEKIEIAKKKGIKAIFYQAETDSRQAEVFARELGGRAVMLEPLAFDYLNNLRKMGETFAEVSE